MTYVDEAGENITDFILQKEAVVFDEHGRITGAKTQGIAYTRIEIAAGVRIMFGTGGYDYRVGSSPRYVDLSGAEPVIVDRPVYEAAFSRESVPVSTESVLAGLPACTIVYDGPESGTHEHPGGDLAVGFVSPGTYTITAEPFPFLPIERTLTVTP